MIWKEFWRFSKLQEDLIINPFMLDKALLKCYSKDLARLLATNRSWVTFGPLTLKMELSDAQKHGRLRVVPSYGEWVKYTSAFMELDYI